MNSETWLEKAERLQRSLAGDRAQPLRDVTETTGERIKIALWLRREFSNEAATIAADDLAELSP
jgi:hypothetical protein